MEAPWTTRKWQLSSPREPFDHGFRNFCQWLSLLSGFLTARTGDAWPYHEATTVSFKSAPLNRRICSHVTAETPRSLRVNVGPWQPSKEVAWVHSLTPKDGNGTPKSCEFKAAPQCHPSKEGLIMGLLKGSLWLIINLRMPYLTEGRCALRKRTPSGGGCSNPSWPFP